MATLPNIDQFKMIPNNFFDDWEEVGFHQEINGTFLLRTGRLKSVFYGAGFIWRGSSLKTYFDDDDHSIDISIRCCGRLMVDGKMFACNSKIILKRQYFLLPDKIEDGTSFEYRGPAMISEEHTCPLSRDRNVFLR